MNPTDARNFFDNLLKAVRASDFRDVLSKAGDYDAATLDMPFGPHQLVWKAFGGNPSNVSTIGLGTKSGRSLTERVTNAIDAILERRFQEGASPQASPRKAAEAWFGRPFTGLFNWKNEPLDFDRQIHVILQDSENSESPTIDVLDQGIGIAATEFPSTILSLQAGNKIRKRYQIGAFGQGGSATLGFCTYAFIASRSTSRPNFIAFTVIRVLRLDASYKEDCFAYLTDASTGAPEIFEVEIGAEPFDIFPDTPGAKVPALSHGTLVRHVSYRLSNLNKALHASPGNLYHYLHFSAFDPIIPFRVVDLRTTSDKDKIPNERVSGSRNRLLRRASQAQEAKNDDSNIRVRHYRPIEYIVPYQSTDACIGVEYWVVLAFKKKGDAYELRGNSNELFVEAGHPIVGTLNGQNQGELTGLLLKQLGYGLLARHMIIHIDGTEADSTVRRELFSTSREGFKDGPVLESILALIKDILAEDEELKNIERDLTDRITKRESESAKAEVKQEVSKLLREAGFSVRDPGKVNVEGRGKDDTVTKAHKKGPHERSPLPTLPYPQVTRFEIVYPIDVFQLPLNDIQSIVVETDADSQYDEFLGIRSDPPVLEVVTRAPLRGGRARWRLKPVSNAQVGQHGEVVTTLTKKDGTQLTSKVLFELTPAREKQSKQNEGQIPPFNIVPVSPDDEAWNLLWPEDGDDAGKQQEHAYKQLHTAGAVNVYFSTIFKPYKNALEMLKAAKPLRTGSFETHYQVWVGYHAILQAQRQREQTGSYDGTNEEVLERLQEVERQTVGRVQVRQALKLAELLEASAKVAEEV